MSVRSRVKRTLASIGYYRSALALSPFDGVAVLTFHGVRGDRLPDGAMRFEPLHVRTARFEETCAGLRELGCTPISLADWRRIASGEASPPPSPVMLTFDDGYRSVLTEALPILERYEVPAIVFVCTGPVQRGERLWFDALAEREGEDAVAGAKTLDFAAWRAMVEKSALVAAPGDPHAPLTVPEVRRLADHPLVTIGAHTVSHPILKKAPLEIQAEEIGRAKVTLEEWTGRPVDAFAYPNGRPGYDFDHQTTDVVGRCGFEFAFTTAEGFARPAQRALEQSRFTMLDSITPSELAHRLAVSWPRA